MHCLNFLANECKEIFPSVGLACMKWWEFFFLNNIEHLKNKGQDFQITNISAFKLYFTAGNV